MKKLNGIFITIIVTALLIALPFAVSAAETGRPFNDVTKPSWSYNSIYNAYYNHLFYGTSENTFQPKTAMNRAMLVTVVYRMAGSPAPGESCEFTDVADTEYYFNAVSWAVNEKIIAGYPDNTFAPNREVSREEMARILYGYSEKVLKRDMTNDGSLEAFIDADSVSDWAEEDIKWTVANRLIRGRLDKTDLYLSPQNASTRAEVACVLTRILEYFNGVQLKDYLKVTISDNNILSISNQRADYWFGKEYDGQNRPIEPLRFQSVYGKYNALAIKTDSQPAIYLTFDEGYENGYTPRILDILKAKNVKAVFFITGEYLDANPGLVQRMINEGHVVGNHSTSHPANGMPSLGLNRQRNDILALQNRVRDQFGYEMTLSRYPAGIYSEQSLQLINSLNMKSVFWSFAYGDYDASIQPGADTSLNKLVSCLHPGGVYLLHAVSSVNASILPRFIDATRAKGYHFALVVNN